MIELVEFAKEAAPPASEQLIAAAEVKLGAVIPPDLKTLLLKSNGLVLRANEIAISLDDDPYDESNNNTFELNTKIDRVYGLNKPFGDSGIHSNDLVLATLDYRQIELIPSGLIGFAKDGLGNFFLISSNAEDAGSVYF